MNNQQRKILNEILTENTKNKTLELWQSFKRLEDPNVIEPKFFNIKDPWDVFYLYSEIVWILEKRNTDFRNYNIASGYAYVYDCVNHFFLDSKVSKQKINTKKFVKLWIKQNLEIIYQVSAQSFFIWLIQWLNENKIQYNLDYTIEFNFEIN
jgi:ABC-type amino acid transport system permease subunit